MVASATLTMLVTDAVSSTSFRHAQGDPAAHERMGLMESVVNRTSVARGGRVVKNTGDGQLVVFDSARSALSAALEIQQSVYLLNAEDPAHAVLMRTGIHTGEAIIDGADVHGTAVVAAFRINAKASAEEVLVSEMVRGVLGGANEFAFIERGRFSLKGFRERWRLYQVPWRPVAAQPEEEECAILVIDVVSATRAIVEMGDANAFQYLRALHAILRAAAFASSAVYVRPLGDGGLAAFPSAMQAVRAAVAIRDATLAYTQENPETHPMLLRMVIHQGKVIREADELYGVAVFIAAAAVGCAGPGEILLTDESHNALPVGTFSFGAARTATVKALPGEWRMHPLL